MHIDIVVDDIDEAIQQITALGGGLVEEKQRATGAGQLCKTPMEIHFA